jgi:hypothetical protein
MGRFAGVVGILLVVAGVVYRIFFWGADVIEMVETDQQNELVRLSNSIVDPLNATTDSVNLIHDLLRRASDPNSDNHSGTISLLEISGDVLPENIAKARSSMETVDVSDTDEAQALIEAANVLLNVYEGFVPVHADLSSKILSSKSIPSEQMREVDITLQGLENTMSNAIDAFSISQQMFLD